LGRWVDGGDIPLLAAHVLGAAVVGATGGPVLPLSGFESLWALVATTIPAGPPLTAPPDRRPFVREGVVQLAPLDSGRLGNPWHRVVIEQTLPQRTSAQLFAFTSDVDRPDVSAADLVKDAGTPPWTAAPVNAAEWLVQSPPGRYLHLAFVLRGTEDRAPVVSAVVVYGTRSSSLQFLPAAYQEDATSASTLDRLLSITDTVLAEVETVINEFPAQLGPGSVDPDLLAWLASWFDLTFDPTWSEVQRRRVLSSIIDLYRFRGTKAGLTRLLELHTGLEGGLPRIVERLCGRAQPALRRWLGPGDACSFTVLLPAFSLEDRGQVEVIERLLRANAPAHATFCLRAVTPGVHLASSEHPGSVVGFDSLVGAPRPWRLPSDDSSGPDTALGRTLPGDPAPPPLGVRVGGAGHASRAEHATGCQHMEDRT
jgi:phage tail-like protein